MLRRQVLAAFAIVLAVAGCSSGDDSGDVDAAGSTTVTTASDGADPDSTDDTSGASASSTTEPSETEDPSAGSQDLPAEIKPIDWITIANGVTLVSFEGGSASASDAVRAIDGEPTQIGLGTAADEPTVYVFELPAETTFDRFAVPDTRNSPGNTTFVGAIEIAGSATSATDGFEVLVSEEFTELPEGEDQMELVPASQEPVTYLRVTLSGALQVEDEHGADKTVVRFSELIGNGTQADVPLSEDFNGIWELTFADNPDGSGEPTELRQEGSRVAGCVGHATVTGTVTGNVARLIGVDTRDERPSAYLLVVDGDGQLRGMESTNNGVFRARIGRIAPDGTVTDCGDSALPAPLACGAVVYVNFDLDSAVIRPDSAQVIDDLHDGLATIDGGQVTVEGHTSTEGTTEYNQDLSERRAQAVVDALIERGTAPDRLEAVGKGESEPLVSETDEASRAINRRVEIDCP